MFKALFGIALMAFAPAVGAFLAVATPVSVVVGTAIATLAGSAILGSALYEAQDLESLDSYASTKLQNVKTNTNPVPIVYGENRIGGNIIWEATGNVTDTNDNTNRDYFAVMILGQGDLMTQNFEVYADKLQLAGTVGYEFTSDYIGVKIDKTTTSSKDADSIYYEMNTGAEDTLGNLDLGGQITPTAGNTNSSSGNGDLTVDGNESTYWLPSSFTNEWVSFDLVSDTTLRSMVFKFTPEIGLEGNEVDVDLVVQYSDDNVNWNNDASDSYVYYDGIHSYQLQTETLELQGNTARYWRVYFNQIGSNGEAVRANEIYIASEILTTLEIPANTTYAVIHQLYEPTDNRNTKLKKMTYFTDGMAQVNIDGSGIVPTTAESSSPVEQIVDIIHNSDYGLSIAESDIDFTSFNTAKTFCSDNSLTSNIAFNTTTNLQSALGHILDTFRGKLIYSQGKYKIRLDEPNISVTRALTDDDILNNSLNVSMRGFNDIANQIKARYIDPDSEWLTNEVTVEDTELQGSNYDSKVIEKILDFKGITSALQASKLAEISLNQLRYSEDASGNRIKQTPLVASFSLPPKHIDLEVGDVVSLTHDLLDRTRQFMILSITTDASGILEVECREYCDTHYRTSSDTAPYHGDYLIS